jgi:hypothetical protein
MRNLKWMCVLAVAAVAVLSTPGVAQGYGNRGTAWRQVGSFNYFLDQHPRIARDLYLRPGLVNDPAYVSSHPALARYLGRHPRVRRSVCGNPRAFMRYERRWQRAERWRGGGGWNGYGWRNGWR